VSSQTVERVTLALADEGATAALAARLARLARRGDLIALAGELGCGKTSFARAFIRALTDPAEEVPSPTFTLVQAYDSSAGPIWHFDLYRLTRPEEVLELGVEEALGDGIVLVEWPDRLGSLLPREHLLLTLAAGPTPGARIAALEPSAAWLERARSLAT
jgi:tRNA threonylcarbamoyladenosine biosynthesis protein TsaE